MGTTAPDSLEGASWNAWRHSWLLVALTAITMLAFAANSLFTRLALQTTPIDPASFTAMRLVTGALTLALIVGLKREKLDVSRAGLLSAALLFIYVVAFSFAYRGMAVGAGALVLFASAQLLMICYGYARGEKTNLWGVALALAGLTAFLTPSTTAPPLGSSALMLTAGLAWGGFSLLGRATASPVAGTASSFIMAVPLALALLWLQKNQLHPDATGLAYAALSGCVTSALGYVVWYWARVRMTAISAGTVQLSVPLLSALLGMLVLAERLSLRSVLAGIMVLIGVALTIRSARKRTKT